MLASSPETTPIFVMVSSHLPESLFSVVVFDLLNQAGKSALVWQMLPNEYMQDNVCRL